ncbi:hypothetical protein QE450_000890 [Paenibacillus sp. SORGH_AS306]|uniref:hypothetical protein n=1 Tax=unclassified Paenibacillus TaxID=185978 RepID=UPI002365EAC4|nr:MULTISPECIES: hypothetical protein [unclassified Paenibacillus]MDQ1233392.1 hypothetical protein [Paenibacillus sp. SORGH_AS_0306]MDR6110432.1 hypothetical protein [Paenibacillus sp. SORGH_AS_0338]WDF49573.1 hypothetical protein PQ460_16355 [Paenibacillus sp. KACC 21273]
MENLEAILALKDVYKFEELKDAIVCNLNQDKIIIIVDIKTLEELMETVYLIPQLRTKIEKEMKNMDNKMQADDIHLSKFLWDIYVVGLHYIKSDEDKFNEVEIAKIHQNRFIARKIIIEYKEEEELKTQFDNLVVPERVLNTLLHNYSSDNEIYNKDEVNNLLIQIKDILETD